MKKLIILFSLFTFHFSLLPVRADEGMWLLPYLNRIAPQMKAHGLKIRPEQIYSADQSSLKDAIVIFGGGCTAEVVSGQGLLLTNHHCGYGNIQDLATPQNDILRNGYWAMDRSQELPAPGLAVTFIRHIEDVTEAVLAGAKDLPVGSEREQTIAKNVAKVTKVMEDRWPGLRVRVQSFMGGNQYFATAMETFSDVRLVGTPPDTMGKFGGDTDNWMWPRHTDDFSMFRIYAGPDNKPAGFSPENVPYQAPVHLKISTKGVAEGDFTMIMGFPGSTDRYMTAAQMEHLVKVDNANRIKIRGERLAILWEDMQADPVVRLKYASKYAGSSNYWKNSIGMNKAIADNKLPERKAAQEERFQAWAEKQTNPEYRQALQKIAEATAASSEGAGVVQTLVEALWSGSEVVGASQRIARAMKFEGGRVANKEEVMEAAAEFFKDYNEPTDRRASRRMFELVREMLPADRLPEFYEFYNDRFVDEMFDGTVYTSPDRLAAAIDAFDEEAFDNDPAALVAADVRNAVSLLSMKNMGAEKAAADWHRVYMRGLAEMDPTAPIYPDANFTIRLTYGNVMPYDPRDGVTYHYYTTLKGVLEKEDPSNPLEFTVDPLLKEAYATSNYGPYGQDGELRLNFLSNNDITGGNSGSGVLNARGELIGLAFDGNWEAMSGDVTFEPKLQRCINVDIRYVLWTIDIYAGAHHLIDEMTIVK